MAKKAETAADTASTTEKSDAQKTEPAIRSEIESLKKDLGAVRSDLKDLVEAVGASGKSRMGEARERVTGATREFESLAEERLQQACDALRKSSEELVSKGRENIEKHPLTTVAGAFVAGLVTAKLLGSK